MIGQLIAWHLGGLHPFEKALTLGLAFGPFLILFVVIVLRRRQDNTLDAAIDQGVEQGVEQAPDETGSKAEEPGAVSDSVDSVDSAATPGRSGPPSPTP